MYIATGSFSKHSVQFLLHTRFAGVCWDWKQTGTGPRIYSLHENTNSRVVQCVKQCISLYWEGHVGKNSCDELHPIQSFCLYLPDTSVFPAIICCRLYSHTSIAPLTWTFSDRITPCCGISTHTSSRLIRSAGIPSFSFLYKTQWNSDKSSRKRGKNLPHVNNCCIYEIRLSNYPSKSSVLVGNLKSFSDTLLAVCSTPTRV